MERPDLRALRHEYADAGIAEADLARDPLTQFDRWFADAEAAGLTEVNAMVVATVGDDGAPTSRFVLLKGVDEGGFVFYTNTRSRKGRDLAHDPRCSLLFPWYPLERQVRVDGVAERLEAEEVAAYFAVRPRGSRIGAWASHQSRPVADRDALDAAYADAERRFEGVEDVPVPEEWGGYRVRPEAVEFWQGRRSRLHDRLVYTRAGDAWRIGRLQP